MPISSPLPSPMAMNRSSSTGSQSIFKKRSTSSLSPTMASAASYLSALSQADARARARTPTPTSTPALSMSSSVTSSSSDNTELADFDDEDSPLSIPARPPTSEQVFTTVHTEFGHCASEEYRHTSMHPPGAPISAHIEKDPPYYILLSTYISYLILICLGHVRDFLGKKLNPKAYRHLMPHDGYAPLNSDFDSFYTRRLKTRMDECFAQPVTGVAGRTIMLLDRISTDYNRTQIITGTKTRALNISSYNYLGFAQARGGCADVVEESIKRYGVSTCGSRLEGGSNELHAVGEALVAKFVGTEDALISSMGFATNSTFIPALVGRGCLVISDELNHTSIRFGVRHSGVHVRMFKHNDMKNLESLLREVISQGQPKTHRPWKKILVIVEGLYSMEGTMCNLPELVQLKQKYKASLSFLAFFYLYVDEAHSIGAIGPHGRGVADYFGVDPKDIDILMGTFTKSFGAAGGYIAGKKALIDRLRVRGYSGPYAEAMTIPVLTQVIASMSSIMGVDTSSLNSSSNSLSLTSSHGSNGSVSTLRADDEYHHPGPVPQRCLPAWMSLPPELTSGVEGNSRLRRLAFNSAYLHRGLDKLGFITYGHIASPIVPLILFNPGKMMMFHRMMKDREVPIIIVVVAYPATPLITTRVRFCVSAAHTKEDIDCVLRACDEIGDVMDLKHGVPWKERWSIDDITSRAVELVNMPEA
ncbi:serine palmitoyltransferase component [Paramarasmius palmivorus]|uniref:serine C-palmitoyltransferase n=1 Tax=Paramarasmius palmivorus TaxID=297713 RepID=A0AAW0DEZ7_9AGAR